MKNHGLIIFTLLMSILLTAACNDRPEAGPISGGDDIAVTPEPTISPSDTELPTNGLDSPPDENGLSANDLDTAQLDSPLIEESDKHGEARVLSISSVYFDDIAPSGYRLTQSWDAMGMDSGGSLYIGFTSYRPDRLEDTLIFMYNHASGERRYIGSFMDTSEAAENLHEGEEIPKGHTRFVYAGGKFYMGSQGFHDFKGPLDDLPNMRGAHLYSLNPETGVLEDLSAGLPGGVVVEHEGIVALSYMPSRGYLVGLTHPHSNIVFYDIENSRVANVVTGIPWEPGLVVSREIVVDDINQRVYLYRGTENTTWSDGTIYNQYGLFDEFSVYMYDLNTDTMVKTDSLAYGGIWGTKQVTKDRKTAYVSHAAGFLAKIDFDTGKTNIIANLLPDEFKPGHQLSYSYSITFSPDETRLYSIPTYAGDITGLYEYNLTTGKSIRVDALPPRVYTGNGIRDEAGNLYFAAFGDSDWGGNCRVMIFEMDYGR